MFSSDFIKTIQGDADELIQKYGAKPKDQIGALLDDPAIREIAVKLNSSLTQKDAINALNELLLKHNLLPKKKGGNGFARISRSRFLEAVKAQTAR